MSYRVRYLVVSIAVTLLLAPSIAGESLTLAGGNSLSVQSDLPDWLSESFTAESLAAYFDKYSDRLPKNDFQSDFWYYDNQMLMTVSIIDYRAREAIGTDGGIRTDPYTVIVSMLRDWCEDVVADSDTDVAWKVPGFDLSFTVEFLKDNGDNLYLYHGPNIWSHRPEYHFPYIGYKGANGVSNVPVVGINDDATVWYFNPPSVPPSEDPYDSKYVFDFFGE